MQVLRRLGYRKTLVGITVFISLIDANIAAIHSLNGYAYPIYCNEYYYP